MKRMMYPDVRAAYYRWRTSAMETVYSRLPVGGVTQPVFLLGCGRSGKSSLAAMLAAHPDITYLDEPRHLWLSAFPGADIWSRRAARRHGRLVMTAEDFRGRRARRLRRLFRLRAIRHGGQTVLEELAVNSFRLDLIEAIFPDARFIHVYRNGLEVADLIAEAARRGRWFGHNAFKWHQLVQHARRSSRTHDLPERCRNLRDRGLLEWRLSTEAAVEFLAGRPSSRYLEINSALIRQSPQETATTVARFLGFREDSLTVPRPRSCVPNVAAAGSTAVPAADRLLGGPLLPRSMSSISGLVRYADEL